jgi:hypothetical protein
MNFFFATEGTEDTEEMEPPMNAEERRCSAGL